MLGEGFTIYVNVSLASCKHPKFEEPVKEIVSPTMIDEIMNSLLVVGPCEVFPLTKNSYRSDPMPLNVTDSFSHITFPPVDSDKETMGKGLTLKVIEEVSVHPLALTTTAEII